MLRVDRVVPGFDQEEACDVCVAVEEITAVFEQQLGASFAVACRKLVPGPPRLGVMQRVQVVVQEDQSQEWPRLDDRASMPTLGGGSMLGKGP